MGKVLLPVSSRGNGLSRQERSKKGMEWTRFEFLLSALY